MAPKDWTTPTFPRAKPARERSIDDAERTERRAIGQEDRTTPNPRVAAADPATRVHSERPPPAPPRLHATSVPKASWMLPSSRLGPPPKMPTPTQTTTTQAGAAPKPTPHGQAAARTTKPPRGGTQILTGADLAAQLAAITGVGDATICTPPAPRPRNRSKRDHEVEPATPVSRRIGMPAPRTPARRWGVSSAAAASPRREGRVTTRAQARKARVRESGGEGKGGCDGSVDGELDFELGPADPGYKGNPEGGGDAEIRYLERLYRDGVQGHVNAGFEEGFLLDPMLTGEPFFGCSDD